MTLLHNALQIQLSTYAHHIGDNLMDLEKFLEKNLDGEAYAGAHTCNFQNRFATCMRSSSYYHCATR